MPIENAPIEIFDVDGTLTRVFGYMPDTTGFETYDFWQLITENFTVDKAVLKKMIAIWKESLKTEKDPTSSSWEMMQNGLLTFRNNVTDEDIRKFTKELTLKFIQHGVVRKEAVAFLEKRAKQGIICIVSTGNYQDGALGFVDALVEKGLLSKETQKKLYVSGAVIDWDAYSIDGVYWVRHANVVDRKLIGIGLVTGRDLFELRPFIQVVYVDDPWIFDRGLMKVAPFGKTYVIPTSKNKDKILPPGCIFITWNEIIQNQEKQEEKMKELEEWNGTAPIMSKL